MIRKTLFLNPLAPFRLDLTVWTLRRREHNQIDRWDGVTYRRVLLIDGQPVEIAVTQVEPADSPRLRVTLIGAAIDSKVEKPVIWHLTRMLGLQVDLGEFYEFAFRQPKLGPLVRRFRGMRPPRFPSVFEALVNAIACQQMNLTVGIIMLNRLAGACGLTLEEKSVVTYAFPRPQDLVHSDPQAIAALGFSRQKVRAMIELATAIDNGQLDVESLAELSDESALAKLQELRGVGRWSAEYVLLRGLGRTHVFPGDDVGARNNLRRWLGLTKPLDYESVREELSRFGEYAGLVYFHLLLDRLSEAGELDASKSPMEARKGTAFAVEEFAANS
jgi:DNA-3-methyladenine glycosylase II